MAAKLNGGGIYYTTEIDDKTFQSKVGKMKGNIADFGKNVLGKFAIAMAAAFSVRAIQGFIKKSGELWDVQEAAEKKLTILMKNAGVYTAKNVDEMKKYASELQSITNYGDEAIMPIIANLSKAKLSTDQLKEATKQYINMQASGQSGEMMVKALEKPLEMASSLRRVGVFINEEQLKTLDIEQQRAVVLDAIKKKYDGVAEALVQPDIQLKNILGDIQERFGEIFDNATESIINEFLPSVIEAGNNIDVILNPLSDITDAIVKNVISLSSIIKSTFSKADFGIVNDAITLVGRSIKSSINLLGNLAKIIVKISGLVNPFLQPIFDILIKINNAFWDLIDKINNELAKSMSNNTSVKDFQGQITGLADSTNETFLKRLENIKKSIKSITKEEWALFEEELKIQEAKYNANKDSLAREKADYEKKKTAFRDYIKDNISQYKFWIKDISDYDKLAQSAAAGDPSAKSKLGKIKSKIKKSVGDMSYQEWFDVSDEEANIKKYEALIKSYEAIISEVSAIKAKREKDEEDAKKKKDKEDKEAKLSHITSFIDKLKSEITPVDEITEKINALKEELSSLKDTAIAEGKIIPKTELDNANELINKIQEALELEQKREKIVNNLSELESKTQGNISNLAGMSSMTDIAGFSDLKNQIAIEIDARKKMINCLIADGAMEDVETKRQIEGMIQLTYQMEDAAKKAEKMGKAMIAVDYIMQGLSAVGEGMQENYEMQIADAESRGDTNGVTRLQEESEKAAEGLEIAQESVQNFADGFAKTGNAFGAVLSVLIGWIMRLIAVGSQYTNFFGKLFENIGQLFETVGQFVGVLLQILNGFAGLQTSIETTTFALKIISSLLSVVNFFLMIFFGYLQYFGDMLDDGADAVEAWANGLTSGPQYEDTLQKQIDLMEYEIDLREQQIALMEDQLDELSKVKNAVLKAADINKKLLELELEKQETDYNKEVAQMLFKGTLDTIEQQKLYKAGSFDVNQYRSILNDDGTVNEVLAKQLLTRLQYNELDAADIYSDDLKGKLKDLINNLIDYQDSEYEYNTEKMSLEEDWADMQSELNSIMTTTTYGIETFGAELYNTIDQIQSVSFDELNSTIQAMALDQSDISTKMYDDYVLVNGKLISEAEYFGKSVATIIGNLDGWTKEEIKALGTLFSGLPQDSITAFGSIISNLSPDAIKKFFQAFQRLTNGQVQELYNSLLGVNDTNPTGTVKSIYDFLSEALNSSDLIILGDTIKNIDKDSFASVLGALSKMTVPDLSSFGKALTNLNNTEILNLRTGFGELSTNSYNAKQQLSYLANNAKGANEKVYFLSKEAADLTTTLSSLNNAANSSTLIVSMGSLNLSIQSLRDQIAISNAAIVDKQKLQGYLAEFNTYWSDKAHNIAAKEWKSGNVHPDAQKLVGNTWFSNLSAYENWVKANWLNDYKDDFATSKGYKLSDLTALGFKKGGLTPLVDPSKIVDVVHGSEFVVKYPQSIENVDLLTRINAGERLQNIIKGSGQSNTQVTNLYVSGILPTNCLEAANALNTALRKQGYKFEIKKVG